MTTRYPDSWSALEHPWARSELLLYLEELASPDPRTIWRAERKRGLISDIDQVFHFFFDDHDFDETDVGYVFFDESEAHAVAALKRALDTILTDYPKGDDDQFVKHSAWACVRAAAASALAQMQTR